MRSSRERRLGAGRTYRVARAARLSVPSGSNRGASGAMSKYDKAAGRASAPATALPVACPGTRVPERFHTRTWCATGDRFGLAQEPLTGRNAVGAYRLRVDFLRGTTRCDQPPERDQRTTTPRGTCSLPVISDVAVASLKSTRKARAPRTAEGSFQRRRLSPPRVASSSAPLQS